MESVRVRRPFHEPDREGLSWKDSWQGEDLGLITCWEVGRRLRLKEPDLAARAEKGELPVLGWKGGVDKALAAKKKYGTLFYLAQWQGLRGEDLDIDPTVEHELVCSRTGTLIVFTSDFEKYGGA